MNIQTLKLDDIKPALYNPRIMTDQEFDGLVQSLKTFGQQENLIVNKNMTLISGHQRLEAMKFLGWKEAECNVVDLNPVQEKKLNLTMNNQAISGKWDELKLSELLEELKLDADYAPLRLDQLEPLDLSEKDEEPASCKCPECGHEDEASKFKVKHEI
jgi:ParB-like chromosome segregation protein Spo0J